MLARPQTGIKFKIVLRAGPGKGTTGWAGPKNIVILASLMSGMFDIKFFHYFLTYRTVSVVQYLN